MTKPTESSHGKIFLQERRIRFMQNNKSNDSFLTIHYAFSFSLLESLSPCFPRVQSRPWDNFGFSLL
ncbi:hypothetical protein B9Z55_015607 [Caenorhabditis nigoni]|uniref:Uncharacterized protein n=1 Tax=Caenorhabditis nigoni TaxID=1611254 RepID=A0A2G5UAY9_9PELO|nr:hypothetical protein B9Z55_015607 [Caenorhabditis nigoni]